MENLDFCLRTKEKKMEEEKKRLTFEKEKL